MKYLLVAVGFLGSFLSIMNGAIKLFGSDWAVARYTTGTRNIDWNVSVLAFCLLFFALATILERLDKK